MKCPKRRIRALAARRQLALAAALLLAAAPAHALKSDRQQPLDARADSTGGTLGDGTATLRGNVEISQGTLLIRADVATVEKLEGRVRRIELNGNPARLQQEIEGEGLVTAAAQTVVYEVATGMVTLSGGADVDHPQYEISGEVLRYDLNAQHFQGSGGDQDGRIRIRLDPEVVPEEAPAEPEPGPATEPEAATDDATAEGPG